MKYPLLIPILFLFSCSVSNKHKTVTKTTVDSTATVKVDSVKSVKTDEVKVHQDSTVTTTEKTDNYTKVTEIEFDTTKKYAVDPTDYFPPVIRIKITENGIKKEKITIKASNRDSSRILSTDTTNLSKITNTKVTKTETVKTKDVKKTSYWGWLWLGLGIIAVIAIGWYFGLWSWFFAIIRRRKEKDYSIKYKK